MQEYIVGYFVVHVQCRRKESSRSLSHLPMSFLLRYRQYEGNVSKLDIAKYYM